MRRPIAATATALLAVGLLFVGSAAASAETGTTDGGSITIPGTGSQGPGEPFPSVGTMSGVAGKITSTSLTLTGLTTTFPEDLQIVIQAPSGKTIVVSAFCGGGSDISNVNLTFIDGAEPLPSAWGGQPAQIVSGTYAPTVCSAEEMLEYPLPAPAPQLPYETTFASINGEDPNGQWQLWVYDSYSGDIGSLMSWTLAVTTEVPAPAVAPAPTLADTGVEVTTISLGAIALLAAGGILLYTRRRYSI